MYLVVMYVFNIRILVRRYGHFYIAANMPQTAANGIRRRGQTEALCVPPLIPPQMRKIR